MTAETITKHEEPIPCDTPFGKALCLAWYDYGYWSETQWMCALLHNGAIVFVPHQDIRLVANYSSRLSSSKPPAPPANMAGLAVKP
ncbi:hypothetical protein SAMN05519103_00364 [Rhizobiales bacterium GAS113]|nr:hypothetical protein SAMN05519103_00364 [Rhizobiales bacterium GAS113]